MTSTTKCAGLAILCCLLYVQTIGQTVKVDTVERKAVIQYTADDNRVDFFAVTPPLIQIPGAPTAFYSYYWEFGDGEYSFDPKPKHQYKKTGEFKAQLWTTNNYDNGKPPPSRPKKIPVKKITYQNTPEKKKSISSNEGFRLQNNRAPSPEEEMVVIVSYKNEGEQLSNGKLYVFFNEDRFKSDNFSLKEVRTHNGEQESLEKLDVASMLSFDDTDLVASTSSTVSMKLHSSDALNDDLSFILTESKANFRDVHVLEFSNMAPGEERNIFYSLTTTPEMIRDTSATVRIRGIYVPKGTSKPKVKDLEMEIVTSHDPNTMSISETRINYRNVDQKELKFKVRFQNNGEGPARSIMIKVDVPELYNKSTLEVIDMYPPCPICPDEQVAFSCLDTLVNKNQIIFHFKNIYLPGSNQKNTDDRDSTKGFVKYSLRFNNNIPKRQTVNRAAIIFDKNDPVLTNRATTRFIPGKSFGVRAGYNYYPSGSSSRSFFAGITLSPYKADRGYWQAELNFDRPDYSDQSTFETIVIAANQVRGKYIVNRVENYNATDIQIFPLSYRYNLNNIFSVGLGAQLRTILTQKTKALETHEYYLFDGTSFNRFEQGDFNSAETFNDQFKEFDFGFFGDLNAGSSRIGPALGIRYIYNKNQPHDVVQFYGQWKF